MPKQSHDPYTPPGIVGSGPIGRYAEMTNLQDFGETRRQELRNSTFFPSLLFYSELVQEGENFFL